jgi:hypothetical protein
MAECFLPELNLLWMKKNASDVTVGPSPGTWGRGLQIKKDFDGHYHE